MGCCRGAQLSPDTLLTERLHPVQDTFVVGCKFSDRIIYPDTFEENPDFHDPVYSTEYGVYQPNCGLDNVMLSWGHDEVPSISHTDGAMF